MFKQVALSLTAFCGLLAAAPPASEPVYVVLYSRFYDHSHQHSTDERIQRLLPMLDRWQKKYPQAGVSALLQFSGTVSEVLEEENPALHLVDQLKDLSSKGLVDLGYTGEDEPSYLYRPKPDLLLANTPELRWSARAEAAERFLTDFKNPITGLPVPGLSGGAKRTKEVFGNVAFLSGITTTIGGDSPAIHEAQKINPSAIMVGLPGGDPRRGIEGYAFSATNFAKFMSPDPSESPEMFWEDNMVRLSDLSLADTKPRSTDEDLDTLKKAFAHLDRSHVRIIKLEVASYRRYLAKRADGSIVSDPLEWLYYHPDDPVMPVNMHGLLTQTEIENSYRKDEAAMKWLLEEYFPANPGSRFISIHELAAFSAPPADNDVDPAQLKALATDLEQKFSQMPMQAPDYGRAGNTFFTLAESFKVLAQGLSNKSAIAQLTPMYGPLTLPADVGATTGSVTVSAVQSAATQIVPKLSNTAWKRVPENAVPGVIEVGSLRLNAAQFLRLMAQAYLDPSPDKKLYVNFVNLSNRAIFMYPKNTQLSDQSNAWTFKPAVLHMDSSNGAATGR